MIAILNQQYFQMIVMDDYHVRAMVIELIGNVQQINYEFSLNE